MLWVSNVYPFGALRLFEAMLMRSKVKCILYLCAFLNRGWVHINYDLICMEFPLSDYVLIWFSVKILIL